MFFFFKQKTAYEMRISDWSSDVCSSDLVAVALNLNRRGSAPGKLWEKPPYHTLTARPEDWYEASPVSADQLDQAVAAYLWSPWMQFDRLEWHILNGYFFDLLARGTDELRSGSFAGIIDWAYVLSGGSAARHVYRSEEHTSEPPSLMP